MTEQDQAPATSQPRAAHRPAVTRRSRSPRTPHVADCPPVTSTLAAARELSITSRRAQGLPDHVTDPAALAHVADLLATAEVAERGWHRSGVPP